MIERVEHATLGAVRGPGRSGKAVRHARKRAQRAADARAAHGVDPPGRPGVLGRRIDMRGEAIRARRRFGRPNAVSARL